MNRRHILGLFAATLCPPPPPGFPILEPVLPVRTCATGAVFDPAGYMGDWVWLTIPQGDDLPMMRMGFFDGNLSEIMLDTEAGVS